MKKILYIAIILVALACPAYGLDIDQDSNDAVDIQYGGHNGNTAAEARTNLGLEIGVDVQTNLTDEVSLYSALSDVTDFVQPGELSYYTDSDVDAHLSGGTGISYSTGTITNDDTGSSAVTTHEGESDPHTGYMLESNIGTEASNYLQLSATPGTPDGTKYLRDDMTFATPPGSSGDVTGPASSTDSNLAAFDGTDGKTLKDSGFAATDFVTSETDPVVGAINGIVEADGAGNISAATSISVSSLIFPNGTDAAPTAEGSAYWNSSTDTLTVGTGTAAQEIGAGGGADLTVTTGSQSGNDIPVTLSVSPANNSLVNAWLSDTDGGAVTSTAPDGGGTAANGWITSDGSEFRELSAETHYELLSGTDGDATVTINDDDEDNSWYPCAEINGEVVCGSAITFDHTAPTLNSAAIGTDGTTWTFAFNENIASGVDGAATGWAASMSTAGAISFSGESITDDTLTLTGSPVVDSGETVTSGLDYTQPGDGVQDTVGNLLANITGAAVTNNSTQGGTTYLLEEDFEGTGQPDTFIHAQDAAGGRDYDYTTTVLEGTESFYLDMGSSSYAKTVAFSPSGDTLYVGTMARPLALGDSFAGTRVLYINDSSGNRLGTVWMETGGIQVEAGGGTIGNATGLSEIAVDTTVYLKFKYVVGSGTDSSLTVWTSTDGTTWTQQAASIDGTYTTTPETIEYRADSSNGMIYDDLRIGEEDFDY